MPYATLTNRHTKAVLDEVDRVIALMEACKIEKKIVIHSNQILFILLKILRLFI